MPDLPVFYYAQGTSWLWNMFGVTVMTIGGIGIEVNLFGNNLTVIPNPPVSPSYVKGLDGEFYYWDGYIPNDPFPRLLSPLLWQYKRVPYPASTVFIGPSIEYGVDWIIADIEKTPIGTPFALGGYSQGAAVMSRIYDECRRGRLVNRRHDLRAVVTFGNPMRQDGHTFPGSSGYSGSCDIPSDTRSGGGIFPAPGSFQIWEPYIARFSRLTNTEDLFWDFTMPNEVISGVGNSDDGKSMQGYTREGLRLIPLGALAGFFTGWINILSKWGIPPKGLNQRNGNVITNDPKTGAEIALPGGGHTLYPHFPPPNSDGSIPTSGDTCYQIAAKYLNKVGAAIYDERNPTVPAPTNPISYQWFSSIK